MNKKLTVLTISLALLIGVAASAQTIHLKAQVPFNFIAGNTMFSAGQYELLSTGSGDKILVIRSLDSKGGILLLSNPCQSLNPTDRTKLVFHRYGQRYFLSEVWIRGNSIGHEVPPSSREVEVARDFSQDEVILVAKR